LSESEIQLKEIDSFTINGKQLSELTGIINEKIKISDTFTFYILERCKPSQVKVLRRFVEEYEKKVELLKNGDFTLEDIELLKMVTVSIDLLFRIDVSYYNSLFVMYQESKIYNVCNYFEDNIDYELNYDDLCKVIKGKGLGKK
jgi:hypothetical protein